MNINYLRIGHKKAFKSWKLIWVDDQGNSHCETISERTAKALIASGMDFEG